MMKHLFFNRLPDLLPTEKQHFIDSGLIIIDVEKNPALAKQSLSSGEVHIFALKENDVMTLMQKKKDEHRMSHAIVANNEGAICLGEVRLRSICVKGKWLKVLDISNDSGHYMPDASSLMLAVRVFESLGYVAHRVTAVTAKMPQTFTIVEEEREAFGSIARALSM